MRIINRPGNTRAKMGLNDSLLTAVLLVNTLCAGVVAQEPPPEPASLENALKEDSFSPYANRKFPSMPLFGDTHVHSSVSMDAGAIGNRLGPEDAFRFARGEEVTSSTGVRAKLSRPLDFLVLSDHSDNMGLFTLLYEADPVLLNKSTIARELSNNKRGPIHRRSGIRRSELPASGSFVSPDPAELQDAPQGENADEQQVEPPQYGVFRIAQERVAKRQAQ